MNMEKFDHDVWKLHHKLFHRYIKYAKYFARATENLPDFQQALADEARVHSSSKAKAKKKVIKKRKGPQHVSVMDVVSSSSEEVSADDTDDEDE